MGIALKIQHHIILSATSVYMDGSWKHQRNPTNCVAESDGDHSLLSERASRPVEASLEEDPWRQQEQGRHQEPRRRHGVSG